MKHALKQGGSAAHSIVALPRLLAIGSGVALRSTPPAEPQQYTGVAHAALDQEMRNVYDVRDVEYSLEIPVNACTCGKHDAIPCIHQTCKVTASRARVPRAVQLRFVCDGNELAAYMDDMLVGVVTQQQAAVSLPKDGEMFSVWFNGQRREFSQVESVDHGRSYRFTAVYEEQGLVDVALLDGSNVHGRLLSPLRVALRLGGVFSYVLELTPSDVRIQNGVLSENDDSDFEMVPRATATKSAAAVKEPRVTPVTINGLRTSTVAHSCREGITLKVTFTDAATVEAEVTCDPDAMRPHLTDETTPSLEQLSSFCHMLQKRQAAAPLPVPAALYTPQHWLVLNSIYVWLTENNTSESAYTLSVAMSEDSMALKRLILISNMLSVQDRLTPYSYVRINGAAVYRGVSPLPMTTLQIARREEAPRFSCCGLR